MTPNKTRTSFRFRLRDTASAELTRQAHAVNFVWNFCNETQQRAVRRHDKWFSGYDLGKLTSGSSKELNIHASTIAETCHKFVHSRVTAKKPWLRWRGRKSLGWVPFKVKVVTYRDGAFVFRGRSYKAWVTRDIEDGTILLGGSFNQDARGRWYINFAAEVTPVKSTGTDAVGIDLGLKDLATLSSGEKVETPRWYRRIEERLATAQRAKKSRRVTALHAKAEAQRADHLHKLSTRLVRSHGAIFVGNVNAAALAKTSMAKSVLDAGWSTFRLQLAYKAIRHGVLFEEVNEAYSTQTCSECGLLGGPRGLEGLGIRRWQCMCGVDHDRDVNAARNIVRRGLAALAEGAGHA